MNFFLKFCIFLSLILVNLFFSQNSDLSIVAFQGIPGQYTNDKNYEILKKAGFTVNLHMYKNISEVQKALDLCEKYDLKLIFSINDFAAHLDPYISQVKDHPALLGYYIEDEPNADRFSELSKIVKKIYSLDKKHITYINLYPNYANNEQLKVRSYEQYVNTYLKMVNPNILSFDHYPLVNNIIRNGYYKNLETIKKNALLFNKPFWAFACSVIHFNYLKPTVAGIKFQQFSNLLYGAKGLQYYSYWGVNDAFTKANNYSFAIVDEQGVPTPTYYVVKVVNQQIKNLSWIFSKSKVDSIYHMGKEIPEGTTRMNFVPKKFKIFKSFDRKALISFMSVGNKKFVIVQNKDIFTPMPFNYQALSGVSVVDSNNGKIKNISTEETIYSIPPGDILIFTYL